MSSILSIMKNFIGVIYIGESWCEEVFKLFLSQFPDGVVLRYGFGKEKWIDLIDGSRIEFYNLDKSNFTGKRFSKVIVQPNISWTQEYSMKIKPCLTKEMNEFVYSLDGSFTPAIPAL